MRQHKLIGKANVMKSTNTSIHIHSKQNEEKEEEHINGEYGYGLKK